MIRTRKQSLDGFAMAELAFSLLVIGLVLGAMWAKVGQVYQNIDVEGAVNELQMAVFSIRQAHPNDKVSADEDMSVFGLLSNRVGVFQGKKTLFNPWHGQVIVFPGNAIAWGQDDYDPEFTVAMTGVPKAACTDLVMAAADPKQTPSLVSVYISPAVHEGHLICYNTDYYCQNPVTANVKSLIQKLCDDHNPMTVMLSYKAH